MKKQPPVGVRIIYFLYFIVAGLAVVLAVLGLFIKDPVKETGLAGMIPLLFTAVISYGIGRGLARGKPWARGLVLIFGSIALIVSIVDIISGSTISLITLALYTGIVGYLGLNSAAKEFFATNKTV